jgi:hypothetical protein
MVSNWRSSRLPPPPCTETSTSDWYIALKRQLHQQVIGAIDLAPDRSLGKSTGWWSAARRRYLPEERQLA